MHSLLEGAGAVTIGDDGGGADTGGVHVPLTQAQPAPGGAPRQFDVGVVPPLTGPAPVVNVHTSDAATSDGSTSVAAVLETTRQ